MAANGGITRLKNTLEVSRRERGDPQVLKYAWAGLYFAMGFLMSGARIMAVDAPFGLAMVAGAGAGINGVSCLVGACLGYFATGGVEWGIKYVSACVLAFTVSFVFQDTQFYKKSIFSALSAGVVAGLTGFLGTFVAQADGAPAAARLCIETVMSFGGCWLFREALNGGIPTTEISEQRHGVAVMLTIACGLMAISRITVFVDISVGRFLAIIVLMTCAMKGGLITGAAIGAALGAAMDISAGGVPFYTMTYAFAGMLSGVFGKHGRLLFVLSFILANAVAVVCAWGARIHTSPLFETFCASVVFMLLPSGWLNSVGVILAPIERGTGEAGLRRFAAKRVYSLSEAYGQLYDTVRRSIGADENDGDISKVFDRAADAVCVECGSKIRCWSRDYQDTLSAMNDATLAMEKRGTLEMDDLPERFIKKCEKPEAFVTAVNGELKSRALRIQYRELLGENRAAAWGQYIDISDILNKIARELASINGSDPLSERRLLRFLKTLDIDAETAVFRDSGGRLRAVIESGQLSALVGDPEYLDKLSNVLGVRLCRIRTDRECSGKLTVTEAEPLAVSVGIAAMKKKGEKVSGDKGTYFKTDSGVLCVILSDGMGCGDAAAGESGQCVAILEKFLRAGVEPATAMKILNSVMLLKTGGDWGFVTVDLMCVNLFSGETCFYKYGAAPSYVMSGRAIKRIKGQSMAAGICAGDGGAPDVVRMKLRPGSTAIIASDGVVSDYNDGWIKELMINEREDMKALARTAVNRAGQLYGSDDDMTVLAVKVETRK